MGDGDRLAPALRALGWRIDVVGAELSGHVGNLLCEGDRMVWADWQVAGFGSPAVDLAFLWSRALADGADLPYAAMMRDYAAHRPCDIAALHRATTAAEIGILLYGWPEYASHLPPAGRDRLTSRLLQLIDDWP